MESAKSARKERHKNQLRWPPLQLKECLLKEFRPELHGESSYRSLDCGLRAGSKVLLFGNGGKRRRRTAHRGGIRWALCV